MPDDPPRPPGAPRGARLPRLIGIATALMCALASGAVWCLAALYADRTLAWLVIPAAALIVWALRAQGLGGTVSGAVAAAAFTLLACAYALLLLGASRLAAALDLPLAAVVRGMDIGTFGAVAWARLARWEVALCVLTALAAAALAARRRR
jgi:hypothetical protein